MGSGVFFLRSVPDQDFLHVRSGSGFFVRRSDLDLTFLEGRIRVKSTRSTTLIAISVKMLYGFYHYPLMFIELNDFRRLTLLPFYDAIFFSVKKKSMIYCKRLEGQKIKVKCGVAIYLSVNKI